MNAICTGQNIDKVLKISSKRQEYAIIEYQRFDGNMVKRRYEDADALMKFMSSLIVSKRKFNVQHFEGDGYAATLLH